MVALNPWRLALLFFISGAATRYIHDKRPKGLLAERAKRLLPPIILGMLVVVPPQTYIELTSVGYRISAIAFYEAYIVGSHGWVVNGQAITTPTWNHLWFVVYLLAYTVVLSLTVRFLPTLPDRLSAALDTLSNPVAVMIVPAVWCTGVKLLIAPRFPETHAFVSDWFVHAQYAPAFILGFAAARSERLWPVLVDWRRPIAVMALISLGLHAGSLVFWLSGQLDPSVAEWLMNSSFGPSQWFGAAAVLAYAGRYLRSFDHPMRGYLTQAIFPFYIVHQTVIILAAWLLRPARLDPVLELAILVPVVALVCGATFEVVRRLPVLRVWFGLAPRRGTGW